ncbi:hypothetical protein E4T49_00901 [Aureobasidium sp. EXF-10728]|nr:hypothetical protein E4T49_00901 [Aureobasidium sp. EXF-10728]
MTDNTRGTKRKRDFFNDQDLSDIIITFKETQIFAHKVTLASGSTWFEGAFLGAFSEANQKIVELYDNVSSDAIMAMLKHLYGMDYKDQSIHHDFRGISQVHLEVFVLGDKYDVDSLRKQAADRFMKFLTGEAEDGSFYDETIHVIQRLLGPDAPELADRSLYLRAKHFILNRYPMRLFEDETFRDLLGKGKMLNEKLAVAFLHKIHERLCDGEPE